MLSNPQKMELWPSLNPTVNPTWESFAPAASGAKKQTIFKRTSYNASDVEDDDGDDDVAGPPEFKSDFGTAIAVALEKQMFNANDSKKSSKKKKRNTVLFSTGLPGRSFKGN